MLPLVFVPFVSAVHAVTISIPLTAPSNATAISPSHFSFSIEQDRWTDWVGATARNEFFFNALDNLNDLSGEPPRIRIGADSEDHTNFQSGLKTTETEFPPSSAAVPYPEATTIVVGEAFYQAAKNLPSGTHVTWGVNFGQDNLTAAVLEARAIADAFSSDSERFLDAIEIGNEADLYKNNGARPSNFSISEYVPQWTAFAVNVSGAAHIHPASTTAFWGGAFADSSHTTTGFSPQGLFSNGILSSAQGKLINTISQHHYSGGSTSASIQDLMAKSLIRGNLTIFSPDISATKSRGLRYVLGETNSYFNHGAAGVSNTAGAALWALDYALFASQIGIERIYFHEGIGYKYNFIQPVNLNRSIIDGSPLATPLPPHIQPAYYAAIIAAEAIGNSGQTTVTELPANDSFLSGYAFFVGGRLSSTLFINSQAFLSGSTNRTQKHLDFTFTGVSAPSKLTVKRLAIGHADDTNGVVWGGQTYETPDARVSGKLSVQSGEVQDGVDISETEAVLITFAS